MSLRRISGVLVLVFGLAACSDDTTVTPDARVDQLIPKPDTKRADAKPDTVKPDSPAPAKFLINAGIGENEGKLVAGGPDVKLLGVSVTATLAPPATDAENKPDFTNVNVLGTGCVGYKWDAGKLPVRTVPDMGNVTFTGHLTPNYVDGAASTPTPTPLAATLTCTRKELATGTGLFGYDCGLPALTVLQGDLFDATVTETVAAAGGSYVTAFTTKTGAPTGPLLPKAPFSLTAIDPAAVKVEWDVNQAKTVGADLVIFQILAQNKTKTKFADILCVDLAQLNSSLVMPADALKLIPAGTDADPVIMNSSLGGYKFAQGTSTWGTYNLVAGRGVFGITCRGASGIVACQ